MEGVENAMCSINDNKYDLFQFLSRLTTILIIFLIGAAFSLQASAWTFVSSPDWFNQDVADLSGAAAGVPEASRDREAVRFQPEDVYDLAPASFADLAPELHELGISWGAAKAHVHLRRRRREQVG